MKARSSMGRNFINVCSCAGLGDIGYFNRWTMEIKNNSRIHTIPLVVGRRIAQIVFFQTDGLLNPEASYNLTGKYQQGDELHHLMEAWTPESMLPKMYKDYETKN
jgi:dCTP deaminase